MKKGDRIKGIILAFAISTVFLYRISVMAQERDPFVSPLDLEKQKAKTQISRRMDLSQFILKGIIWNENLSVAIINDELFMTGDDCKGLKVESINKDAVTLTDGTDSFELSIADEIVPSERTQLAQGSIETLPNQVVTQRGPAKQQRVFPQDSQGVFPPSYPTQDRDNMPFDMYRER